MTEPAVWHPFQSYLLAMALGALMGLERERSEPETAGLRTFILATLFGAICGDPEFENTSSWLMAAGLLAVGAQATMIHFLRLRKNLSAGMTTSIALLVAYGVGLLVARDNPVPAITVSLATTVILYFKLEMHEFSRRLQKHDLVAIFQFILVTFIIWPVLPNRGYGPFQALNPSHIWLMVVLISTINLTAYVFLKLVGQRWSGPILGVLGGLVSSTATTLSFSRYCRGNPDFSRSAAVVVSLASTIVLIRVALLAGVIHPPLLSNLRYPLIAMFIAGLIPVFLLWRSTPSGKGPGPTTKNPVELPKALMFGLIYGAVILAVSAAKEFFGDHGVYVVAFLSGLTDLDAITLSSARLAQQGVLQAPQATISILIALISNLGFKLGLVAFIGNRQMFRWTLCGFSCLALPALLALAWLK